MDDKLTHGVIANSGESGRSDYLYRVALKAVILDQKGYILLVKESGREWWDIPGGGLDHGESIKAGLARELFEEVGYKGDFTFQPLEVSEPQFLETRNMMQIRVMFLVTPSNMNFEAGNDGDDIIFMDPNSFKDSLRRTEQEIYRYSRLSRMLLEGVDSNKNSDG